MADFLIVLSLDTPVEFGIVVTFLLALIGSLWKIYAEIKKASYRMGKLDQTILNLDQDVKELKSDYKQVWMFLFGKFADFKDTKGADK